MSNPNDLNIQIEFYLRFELDKFTKSNHYYSSNAFKNAFKYNEEHYKTCYILTQIPVKASEFSTKDIIGKITSFKMFNSGKVLLNGNCFSQDTANWLSNTKISYYLFPLVCGENYTAVDTNAQNGIIYLEKFIISGFVLTDDCFFESNSNTKHKVSFPKIDFNTNKYNYIEI